jgi:F-type H+-transporting ATPase subunit b
MEINWFTIVAQIVNFFILVWLLKRFLYKPILDAIAKREQKIVDQLNDAEAKKTEAQKEQEEFKQKNLDFEVKKKELMDAAISESKEMQDKLLEKARAEAEALKNHLEKTEKEKRHNREATLAQKVQEEVFSISRKTLQDLSSVSFEEQATAVFINRLKSLKDEDLDQFKSAFKDNKIILRSAFPLSDSQQKQIEEQIIKLLQKEIILKVEVSEDLIGGIELSTRDYKLSWSISGYLKDLEDRVFEKNKIEETGFTAS